MLRLFPYFIAYVVLFSQSGISVDDDSSSLGSKHSPPGIFKKIRSSMRKRRPNEDESPTEEKEGMYIDFW